MVSRSTGSYIRAVGWHEIIAISSRYNEPSDTTARFGNTLLVAGLVPPRSGFDSRSNYSPIVVEKVALGQRFLRALSFYLVRLITLNIRVSIEITWPW